MDIIRLVLREMGASDFPKATMEDFYQRQPSTGGHGCFALLITCLTVDQA